MNNELLAMLDYLERDRGLEREILAKVIAEALEAAARKALGPTHELHVEVDPRTGDITAVAKVKVVSKVFVPESEVSLREAKTRYPDVEIGDEIEWEVPTEDFGRIAAQTARQGIMQRLRAAEKDRVCEEYEDRLGEVLYGTVTRYDRGDVIVSLDRTEGVLRREDRAPTEDYQVGDHICCILKGLNPEGPGAILELSRSDPKLVIKLFEREVTEIAEGIVDVKGVAREAGFRTKIAVHSNDSKVDPVGACVGLRGSRVKSIVRELGGEKVDIIRWDPDMRRYIANALQPAEIRHLIIDEPSNTVNIMVDPDQLSLAIGKRGQNARLTAKLTGWRIDINKIEEEVEPTLEDQIQQAVEGLAKRLGVAPEVATLLVNSGFTTAEGIREADAADLAAIDGIDELTAAAIKTAAGD